MVCIEEHIWRVGYEAERVPVELEGITINGKPIAQRFVGYILEPGRDILEARQKAVAVVSARAPTRTLGVRCWNTELYHGEPIDALTAKRAYELQKQRIQA